MGKGGGMPGSPTDKAQAKKLKAVEADIGQPTRAVVAPKALETLTNENPFATSLPGSARDMYEKQFAQANADIQAGAGGRGGMLRNALVQNANQRAATIAKANDDYRQLGIERAMNTLVPAAIPDAQTQASMASGIAGREAQRNQANYQAQQQAKGDTMSGVGALGGLALMMMSSREFKRDIEEINVDTLLADIANLPVYTWKYKGDDRTHLGPVVEEAPAYLTEGKYLNAQDCIGFLFGTVKALANRVKELEKCLI